MSNRKGVLVLAAVLLAAGSRGASGSVSKVVTVLL
jgi:hypothetical protein